MDKALLQKYVEGRVTAKEVETVVNWLDADKKHVKEFMALHKLYDISVLNPTPRASAPVKKRTLLRRVTAELIRAAAVILLLFGGKYLFDRTIRAEEPLPCQTLYIPAGQRAQLILPDSTRVWLNARSRLVYPVNFGRNTREVELDGEAYFNVKPDTSSPFVVKTKTMDIQVLGTEFNVSAYSETQEFKIALLKGRVNLQPADRSRTSRMQPGEQIRYRAGRYTVSRITDFDYFRWKEGLLCFNNQTIDEIMEKLASYYDIRIETDEQPFLQEYYSGKFRAKDGVEQVLKVLQLEHRFTYTQDNESNVITIK